MYAQHDRDLTDAFLLKMQVHRTSPPVGCGGGGAASTGLIEFQFPPKITSDSRKGNWAEGDLRGETQIAEFATAGPREISMRWTYIVDADKPGGNGWSIKRITKMVRTLRGYFAILTDHQTRPTQLSIDFKFWCIGGSKKMTGRMKGVDIKYGETLVMPEGANGAFPLRTDITADLRLWTQRGYSGAEEPDLDIRELEEFVAPDWY